MYTKIKHRYSGDILISGEYKSLRDCVEQNRQNLKGANLRRADLRGADLENADLENALLIDVDLRNANLTNACLKGAYLRNVKGNNREIKNINGLHYSIAYTKEILWIGCEGHLFENWKKLTTEEIEKMDYDALEWWNKNKEFVLEWWKENKEFIFETIKNDPAI